MPPSASSVPLWSWPWPQSVHENSWNLLTIYKMIYFNYFADWNFPGVVMMEFQFLTERGTEVYTHADPLCIHDMFGAKRFAKKAKCFWKAEEASFPRTLNHSICFPCCPLGLQTSLFNLLSLHQCSSPTMLRVCRRYLLPFFVFTSRNSQHWSDTGLSVFVYLFPQNIYDFELNFFNQEFSCQGAPKFSLVHMKKRLDWSTGAQVARFSFQTLLIKTLNKFCLLILIFLGRWS